MTEAQLSREIKAIHRNAYGLSVECPGNPRNIAEAKRLHAKLVVLCQQVCAGSTRRQTLIRTQFLMKLRATIIPYKSLRKAARLTVTPLMEEVVLAQRAIWRLCYATRKAQAKNRSYAQVEVDLRVHQRNGMTVYEVLNPERAAQTRRRRLQRLFEAESRRQAEVLIGRAGVVNVL